MRMLTPDAMASVLKKKKPEKKHFHVTRTGDADVRDHVRASHGAFARAISVGDALGRRRK